MRGGKSGETLTLGKSRGVKNTEKEIIPTTRILRSHKRKLTQPDETNNVIVEEKRRKRSVLCDASDCIVLSDSDAVKSDVNKPITSTPLRRNTPRTPNFNISCVRPEAAKPNNDPVDVIVISDSSAATLPVIVLSDEDEPEVEVIPTAKKKRKTTPKSTPNAEPKSYKKTEILTTVNNNEHIRVSQQTNLKPEKILTNKSKSKLKRHRFDRKYRKGDRPFKPKQKTGDGFHFGENIYIENPVALPKTGLRPIIIDGSNVAFHHSNNSYFSCKGLDICIKYFKARGHEVIAFVPQYRVKYNESDNPKLLDLLVKSGDVVLTPSRMVNGSMIVPYDDRFIVQTAAVKGGIIVTRDNYRDLLVENPLWADTIKYRLLQFTWVQDLLMFPNDPLGKRGPSLEEFLRFG